MQFKCQSYGQVPFMNLSARNMLVALVSVTIMVGAAPEKPKFNPDEALGFLETLSTIQDGKPDVNLLAKLFKARYAPGAGDDFVKAVETFVSAGLLSVGRSDLYFKHVKSGCKFLAADELERQVMRPCQKCHDGTIRKRCPKCEGSRNCYRCEGYGRLTTNITTLYDSRFPNDTKTLTTKCGTCSGSGRCSCAF